MVDCLDALAQCKDFWVMTILPMIKLKREEDCLPQTNDVAKNVLELELQCLSKNLVSYYEHDN